MTLEILDEDGRPVFKMDDWSEVDVAQFISDMLEGLVAGASVRITP